MDKRIVLILLTGLALGVSLASAASCPSCCCYGNCLCPFWDNESCAKCFNASPCPPCLCPFGNESCYENWNMFGNIADVFEDEDTIFPDKTGTIKPGFYANQTSGSVPMTVQFTDTSTGNPNIWGWDFGDGTNSALQNPVHAYTWPGSYTVTLTVKKYVKDGTRESLMTAKIYKPDYINAGGQASSQGTAQESANNVVSSPSGSSQSQRQSSQILQPVLVTPYYVQPSPDPVPLYYGDIRPFLIMPLPSTGYVQSPLSGTGAIPGSQQSMVYVAGGISSTISVPMNFLLGYTLNI